MIKQAYWYE